jgi:uracil-DNA glycosylase family 4
MELDLHCLRCRLSEKRIQVVPSAGDVGSPVVFVGEGPGEMEDQRGLPFVGRAGKMLDRLMKEEGLAREKIMITNTVKCRPPENRRPLPDEMKACFHYLEQELESRQLIVAMGRTACENLLGRAVKVGQEVNTFVMIELMGKKKEVLLTYHPSACLYNLKAREGLRASIRLVRERFFESETLLP